MSASSKKSLELTWADEASAGNALSLCWLLSRLGMGFKTVAKLIQFGNVFQCFSSTCKRS